MRRRRYALVLVSVVLVGAGAAAAVLGSARGAPPGSRRPAPSRAQKAGSTTGTTLAPSTTTTDPGSLPQTDAFPSSTTPQFQAEMAALWSGVVTGSLSAAMPAFFPETAYLQVKSIADPAADYENRLVAQFAADLAAAHALLGTDAAAATLVSVNVPSSFAHWVPPGTCENGVGYFEVPNSRVVYQEDGQVRSFGIASMISWRGVWYVVHLGAVVRATAQGLVDDPEAGPGTPVDLLTC